MHRGSSKAVRDGTRSAGSLPLSASSSSRLVIEVEVARAGRSTLHAVPAEAGTLLRDVIRHVGQAPEGSAALIDGIPVPLDTPLERSVRVVVVPTFSGG